MKRTRCLLIFGGFSWILLSACNNTQTKKSPSETDSSGHTQVHASDYDSLVTYDNRYETLMLGLKAGQDSILIAGADTFEIMSRSEADTLRLHHSTCDYESNGYRIHEQYVSYEINYRFEVRKNQRLLFSTTLHKTDFDSLVDPYFLDRTLVASWELLHYNRVTSQFVFMHWFAGEATDFGLNQVIVLSESGQLIANCTHESTGGAECGSLPMLSPDSLYLLTCRSCIRLQSPYVKQPFGPPACWIADIGWVDDQHYFTICVDTGSNHNNRLVISATDGRMIKSMPFSGYSGDLGYYGTCYTEPGWPYIFLFDESQSAAWLLFKDGSLLMQKIPLSRMQKTSHPEPGDFRLDTHEYIYWFGDDSVTGKWHYTMTP